MSKFQRESKYWVVKRTDLEKHLDPDTCCQVEEALIHVDASRLRSGKKSLQGVFIRDTSPFYEEAWNLVEQEATGIAPTTFFGKCQRQNSKLHKECAHLTELFRQARVALHEMATHEELADDANAYWILRNEAEATLARLKDYDVAVMATQAVLTGMLCPHGQGLTDYCQPCGRVSGGGP